MSNLCKIPFKEIYIEQAKNGIGPCCQMRPVSDLDKRSLTENFKSNSFLKQLRQDFLDDKRPSACNRCWDLEDQGLTSYRTSMSEEHTDTTLELTVLDIRLGNKCNLACKMCTPEYSNQLAKKMYDAIQEGAYIPSENKKSFEWQEILKTGDAIRPVNENLVNNIYQTIMDNPTINLIKFGGGEPFIMPEVSMLLKKLVESGRSKTLRVFTLTNCTTVKTSFLKLLENFLDVEISCSIDGVGKWIEYQRTGSNWESIKRNFSKLQQSNISTVSLTPVITQLNVLGVADFLEWAITQNACYIAFNEIQHPEWFRWQLVPLEYRKKVLKKLNKLNLEQHNIDPNWLQFRKNLKTEVQTLDEETRHRWSGDLILWEYGSNEKYFDHYPWGKALYEGTL